MIYNYFMKKRGNETPPFPTAMVVNEFASRFAANDITICLPGYMSTSVNTINAFTGQIRLGNYTYFAIGMNGQIILNNSTIQHEYNLHYQGIPFSFCEYQDHSKMMFFINNPGFDLKNKDDYDALRLMIVSGELEIKAILIGSSNQSFATYFGGNKHGEADILLVNGETIYEDDNVVEQAMLEMFNSLPDETRQATVLSKELTARTNAQLLLNIFNQTITNIR